MSRGFIKKVANFFNSLCVPIRLVYRNLVSATAYCIFQPIPHAEDVAQKYLPLTLIIIADYTENAIYKMHKDNIKTLCNLPLDTGPLVDLHNFGIL